MSRSIPAASLACALAATCRAGLAHTAAPLDCGADRARAPPLHEAHFDRDEAGG